MSPDVSEQFFYKEGVTANMVTVLNLVNLETIWDQ